MPNRDYYLKTEDTYVEFRKKYVDYLAKLLTLAGEADGPARAAKILELETKLATDQWTPVAEPRPGQDLQQAQPRVGGEARARLRLERLVRRHAACRPATSSSASRATRRRSAST